MIYGVGISFLLSGMTSHYVTAGRPRATLESNDSMMRLSVLLPVCIFTLQEESTYGISSPSNNNNNNGRNGSFLCGWLPHRGKAQMACNYCFPTRTMF